MFPVYSEAPTRATDPFAVTDGKFKAHFYTKGSGTSFGASGFSLRSFVLHRRFATPLPAVYFSYFED